VSSRRALACAATAALLGAGCADPLVPFSPIAPGEARLEPVNAPPQVIVRPRLVNMGRLRPGAGHSRRIEAQVTSGGALITGAVVDDPRFTIEEELGGTTGGRAAFSLRFDGSREIGPVAAEIVVGYRDPAGAPGVIAVPVVGSVVGDLRVARGLYLHKRGGRFAPRDVVVGRRSGKPVHILSVEDPDGLLDVTLVEPRSRLASFRVAVADPGPARDGSSGHPLLLHVDDADESPVNLEYRIDSRGE
jgi:hypothetical protein